MANNATTCGTAAFMRNRSLTVTALFCMLIFFSMSVFQKALLKDRVAFVTGGSSGIGQRMAERFAEHGAKVMLIGRKQEKLDAAASGIRNAGGTVATAALDVREYPAVEAALKRTREELGEVDIL